MVEFVENAYLSHCCKVDCFVGNEGSLGLFDCTVHAPGDVLGSGACVLFPGGVL